MPACPSRGRENASEAIAIHEAKGDVAGATVLRKRVGRAGLELS